MNSLSRTTRYLLRPSSAPNFFCQLLAPQVRHASILGTLSDVPEAYNKRIRRGRGPSSGKGKTSGRGHKGQKQHGKVPAGFQGGQTPLEIVHGERGFKNMYALSNGGDSPLRIGDSIELTAEIQLHGRNVASEPRKAAGLD
jgi:large subunit ribosomal protein L15